MALYHIVSVFKIIKENQCKQIFGGENGRGNSSVESERKIVFLKLL